MRPDRGLQRGKIEQIGTPAEMYEHPPTRVRRRVHRHSNVSSAERPTFTVRPEKIRVLAAECRQGEPGWCSTAVATSARHALRRRARPGRELRRRSRTERRRDVRAMAGQACPARVEAGRGVHDQEEQREAHSRLAASRSRARRRARGAGGGHLGRDRLPTKVGKGEGALSVVEWGGYTDPSFAKKFEQQTGCKIKRKDAGSSNEMFNVIHGGGGGGGGQYDLVSASGDASLRLIYAVTSSP